MLKLMNYSDQPLSAGTLSFFMVNPLTLAFDFAKTIGARFLEWWKVMPFQRTRTYSKINAFAVGENDMRSWRKEAPLEHNLPVNVIAEVLGITAGQVNHVLAGAKATSDDSINVEWDEVCTFLLSEVQAAMVTVEVFKSHPRESVGKVKYPVSELLRQHALKTEFSQLTLSGLHTETKLCARLEICTLAHVDEVLPVETEVIVARPASAEVFTTTVPRESTSNTLY